MGTPIGFVPPHWQMLAAWWFCVAWGGAGLLVCFTWIWGEALRRIGTRCMESKQFFDVVVRYARERNTKRVMGINE